MDTSSPRSASFPQGSAAEQRACREPAWPLRMRLVSRRCSISRAAASRRSKSAARSLRGPRTQTVLRRKILRPHATRLTARAKGFFPFRARWVRLNSVLKTATVVAACPDLFSGGLKVTPKVLPASWRQIVPSRVASLENHHNEKSVRLRVPHSDFSELTCPKQPCFETVNH